jgi:hypothetical protein
MSSVVNGYSNNLLFIRQFPAARYCFSQNYFLTIDISYVWHTFVRAVTVRAINPESLCKPRKYRKDKNALLSKLSSALTVSALAGAIFIFGSRISE